MTNEDSNYVLSISAALHMYNTIREFREHAREVYNTPTIYHLLPESSFHMNISVLYLVSYTVLLFQKSHGIDIIL